MTLESLKIAVLGCGQMGGALVRGWVGAGVIVGGNVRLFDVKRETAQALADEVGASVATADDSMTGAEFARSFLQGVDVLLLCVKPAQVAPLLSSLRRENPLGERLLVVSIAAGVRLATLEEASGGMNGVIRVMPNTPALVGEGASAFCRGTHATDDHAKTVQTLFGAVGSCVEVPNEALIDAVIGVAGSAPAYFYLIIEALTDGGVRAGLPRDTARTLAAQTMLGSAKMILTTGTHPMALKDAVTTPGGTTIAALGVLESGGLRGTLMDAVRAAAERSKEMG
ncbi:MAG: pyrroline-5-carboxylate reductase [Akkermansiaceae bacterium]|nr:pyrroline-5-carboxylate reductase [Armatimonadota bacterium]